MASNVAKLKRIGILGGSSDQATADYYKQLNKETNRRSGGFNTAELILTSMNFAFSELCVREERYEEMGAYLADRAKALEAGGAETYLCVSNTWHLAAPYFMPAVNIPFLHIADPTARTIHKAGLERVALLGTKTVMTSDFQKNRYENNFGIDIVLPGAEDIDTINGIIFDELCMGVFTEESRDRYLEIVDRLAAAGAQGIILGCTEIPLLINQSHRPDLPMFDTMALHVSAAVDFAFGVEQ